MLIPFLINTCAALKGSQFYFYLHFLQLVLCRVAALKKSPRKSYIVQIVFSFCSFEISEGILRNQKINTGLDLFSNQRLTHISLASFLCDIGKQYSPRCDAAERGVPSGAILFAKRSFIEK